MEIYNSSLSHISIIDTCLKRKWNDDRVHNIWWSFRWEWSKIMLLIGWKNQTSVIIERENCMMINATCCWTSFDMNKFLLLFIENWVIFVAFIHPISDHKLTSGDENFKLLFFMTFFHVFNRGCDWWSQTTFTLFLRLFDNNWNSMKLGKIEKFL